MNDNLNDNPNQPDYMPPSNSEMPASEPAGKPVLRDDEKRWAMFCHLAGFAFFIPIFIGQIIAPLILWLVKKDESSYIDDQGKEALNFQISITIYLAVAALFFLVLIGIPIFLALILYDIVMIIKAVNAVSKGEYFRYPYTIRLIS